MRSWIFAALLLLPSARLAAQNIGINANGATPNTSAMLDIDVSGIAGTKRGLLIPRMTTVQRNAIVTPATSLLVFNTTTNQFEYFDGAIWRALLSSAAAGWTLTGNTIAATDFIGTLNNQPLVFRVNNQPAGRLEFTNQNSFFGSNTGVTNTGIGNTFIGAAAGNANSSGGGNTFIGAATGQFNTNGTENTVLGFSANVSNGVQKATAIGANALVTQSNSLVLGGVGANAVNVGIGTTAPTQPLDVIGKARVTDFQMTNGALNGSILMGDGTGNAFWANPTGNAVNAWDLTGNTGTNPSVNFVGTSDNTVLRFRTNSIPAGLLDHTASNAFYGTNAGISSGGSGNTFLGALAGNANSTGGGNTFVGTATAQSNSTGTENTALGFSANVSNALQNATAIGNRAFATQSNSVVLGSINGVNGSTASTNVGIGTTAPAQRLHVVGNIRMEDGNQAAGRVLVSNANGTATWTDPLAVATGLAWTLTGNVGTNPATNFLGTTDAQPLRLRTANTFAGNVSNTPTGLVSLGLSAGPTNTGLSNTFVGGTAGVANTTGTNNTFLGQGAGAANTTTSNNTYLGTSAGAANATGQQNVYIGRLAGGNGISGSDNILIGNGAGIANTANNNVMIGSFSGNANSTGGGNTFMGTQSGASSTTGGQNTFIGTGAGLANTIGAQNTLIGNGAAVNANNLTNAAAIGRASRVDVNDGLVLGSVNGINAATSTSLVGIGTTAPLDRLHVVGNIRMVDGNQALGRVLTSDANGTATWQTASAGGTTLDGAYDFGGAGVGRTITADAGAVTIAGTDGFLTTGTLGAGADPQVVGAGTRMFFNPKKAAFRAGQVNGVQWNTANVGNHSVAMGLNTTASGVGSLALGEAVAATALGSAAIGFSNTASGIDSKAIGSDLIASGPATIALGNDVTTSGTRSAGLGDGLLVRSASEVALGLNNTDYVPNSTAVFNAADRLLVVGNGATPATRSDALVILKNGNTGIGSSTPADRLHVVGSIRMVDGNQAVNKVLVSDANGTASWQALGTATTNAWGLLGNAGTTPATNFIGTTDFQSIRFRTGNFERMTLSAGGFLGIGTMNPQAPLHVALSSTLSGVGGYTEAVIRGEANGNAYVYVCTPNLANSGIMFGTPAQPFGAGIDYNFGGNGDMLFRLNNGFQMAIDGPTGNVGIGTIAPVAKFQVNEAPEAIKTQMTQGLLSAGHLITTDFTAGSYTPGLFWSTSNNNGTKPKAGIYLQETNTGTSMYLGTSNNYSTGITNDGIVIDPVGNVGIGTNAPLTTVDMLGALTIRDDGTITSVTVDNQLITVGNRGYIRLNSSTNLATARTITLSDGLVRGQLLILQNSLGVNSFEVDDNALTNNTVLPVARTLGFNDTIMLLWTGIDWTELSYSDN